VPNRIIQVSIAGMRKTVSTAFILLLVVGVPGHAGAADVAVTLPPLAGLVSILDKQADILCLLHPGADPHHFQLQPRTIEALRQSRLLIRASGDDGGWPLPPEHENTLDLWPAIDHGWLVPAMARNALIRIAPTLLRLHPERSDAIAYRLTLALAQIRAMEDAWRKALEPVKKSGVIMQHPAWRRLMQDMGVPVLKVLESGHHGHEYGPRLLDEALLALNNSPGAWLISSAGHSNRAVEWLARHVDSAPRHITLDALGACGDSWPELMQKNLQRINLVNP